MGWKSPPTDSPTSPTLDYVRVDVQTAKCKLSCNRIVAVVYHTDDRIVCYLSRFRVHARRCWFWIFYIGSPVKYVWRLFTLSKLSPLQPDFCFQQNYFTQHVYAYLPCLLLQLFPSDLPFIIIKVYQSTFTTTWIDTKLTYKCVYSVYHYLRELIISIALNHLILWL